MIGFGEGTGDFTPLKSFQIASANQSISHFIGAGGISPLAKDPSIKLLYPPSTAELEDAWCHTSNRHELSYGGVQ